MEMTLTTGAQGDRETFYIEWRDHNNVLHHNRLDILIEDQDKPRTLRIEVDGNVVARSASGKVCYPPVDPPIQPQE